MKFKHILRRRQADARKSETGAAQCHPPTASILERLPPEILYYIISLACDDKGQAECSLSLVSKYISAVTEPFKYQFSALSGTSQMKAFANALLREPRRVSYVASLFVSDEADIPDDELCRVTRSFRKPKKDPNPVKGDNRLAFSKAFLRVLKLISPTLRTCTISIQEPLLSSETFRTVIATPFPALSRLTFRLNRLPAVTRLSPISLPKMECLHLSVANYLHQKELSTIATISSKCPSLSTLLLSGAMPDIADLGSPEDLEPRALGPAGAKDATDLPANIRHVMIQRLTYDSQNPRQCRQMTLRETMEDSVEDGLLWLPKATSPSLREWKELVREDALEGGSKAIKEEEGQVPQRVYPVSMFSALHTLTNVYVYLGSAH